MGFLSRLLKGFDEDALIREAQAMGFGYAGWAGAREKLPFPFFSHGNFKLFRTYRYHSYLKLLYRRGSDTDVLVYEYRGRNHEYRDRVSAMSKYGFHRVACFQSAQVASPHHWGPYRAEPTPGVVEKHTNQLIYYEAGDLTEKNVRSFIETAHRVFEAHKDR